MSTSHIAPAPEQSQIDPAVMRSVWVVMVGGMAVLFDTTIVAVALHTLAADLHAPISTIQWVTTGYLLALAVTIPLVGWAQRVLGTKRLWLLALSLFLAGSVMCSLAWSAESLIAFRIVQGIGGGILTPLMSTIVMQAAGGKSLGKIMSIVSLPAVLGPILGPVVSGLILQHLHWSWLFWVNVPFCVAGLILAVLLLPRDGAVKAAPLDGVGFVFMALGLASVIYGFSRSGSDGGFTRPDAYVPLIIGALLLAAFTAWALRRRGKALLDLRLLRHWPLASSSLLLFLAGLTLYGAMILIPLYFQTLRGASALEAGLLLIPQGLGTFLVRSFVGKLSDRISSRIIVTSGFLVVLLGTIPFAFAGTDTSYLLLLLTLFVRGAGLGAVTMPLMALGYRGLQRDQVPDASIITRVAQQTGGSFGAAVLTVILTTGLAASPTIPANGFQQSFWWAIGFTTLGVIFALLLPGKVPDSASER